MNILVLKVIYKIISNDTSRNFLADLAWKNDKNNKNKNERNDELPIKKWKYNNNYENTTNLEIN